MYHFLFLNFCLLRVIVRNCIEYLTELLQISIKGINTIKKKIYKVDVLSTNFCFFILIIVINIRQRGRKLRRQSAFIDIRNIVRIGRIVDRRKEINILTTCYIKLATFYNKIVKKEPCHRKIYSIKI